MVSGSTTVRGGLIQNASMHRQFELFCSYARDDNDEGWADKFVASVTATYRRLTGQAPRIFIDRESLVTADIWETKIKCALTDSQVLVAVISPSYIRSEWCRREWKEFSDRETQLREKKLLADEQGIIFPILLFPLERGRFSEQERIFCDIVKERQWLDVSSQLEGTPIRPDQIRHLTEGLIDTMDELEQRRRRAAVVIHDVASGVTIHDPISGLEWTASSQTEMTFKAAQAYVSKLVVGDSAGWRLPTKRELEDIIDPTALVDDPKADPFPLREPFNSQRFGYLHSGTLVGSPYGDGHNFIMNVRNGHIFNGHGYKCYVRAVRELPTRRPSGAVLRKPRKRQRGQRRSNGVSKPARRPT